MNVITTIREMREVVNEVKRSGKSIGLVPTMGYLHEGHLSLVHAAVRENDFVVLTVFVNPLQFGPNEDFEQYPRDLQKDEKEAKHAGVNLMFCPSTTEMYPEEPTVTVSVNKRADVLCGKSRPGHFNGVATVLTKFFHIIMPDRVYFGMKDAQQAAVVDGLIRDLNFPIQWVGCPTVREHDGLAKSSRNVYLSEAERTEAPALYESLRYGARLYENGERNTQHIRDAVFHKLSDLLTNGTIEYVDMLTYPELRAVEQCEGRMIIALAVRFQAARLIDNVVLQEESERV